MKITNHGLTLNVGVPEKNFRKHRRLYNKNKNNGNFINKKASEKAYKKVLDKSIKKYRKDMKKKMKNMKTKNPKEYWRLLNNGPRQRQPNIPLELLHDFFKNLNSMGDRDEGPVLHDDNIQNNEVLNSEITGEEILKCISKLKNNKASGDDKIVNEYIKASADLLLPLYVKLFNLIFDTGIIPDAWLTGNIHPIYKGKGNNLDPNNFRPITILSCFGKLFTAVLNDRLTKFSDDFSVIYNNQSGFRKNYSTVDNIFILHILFEFMKNKKRKKNFFVPSLTLPRLLIQCGEMVYGTSLF